jgi:hypothetical protein
MRANLPPAPPAYDASYFSRAFSALDQAIGQSVTKIEAVESVLLQSPNGSVYKLTIDNAGNLVTTAVPLGQSGSPPY